MGSVRLCAAALLLLAVSCCLWPPALGRPSSSTSSVSSRWPLLRLRRSTGAHYCGSHLANMLEMLCGVTVGKRPNSGAGSMPDFSGDRRLNELGSMVPFELPTYGRSRLLGAVDPLQGGGGRRESRSVHFGGPDRVRVKRQGIVYECCFNACSIQVLKSYCNS